MLSSNLTVYIEIKINIIHTADCIIAITGESIWLPVFCRYHYTAHH